MGDHEWFDPDQLPEDPDPEYGADGRRQNDRAPLEGEIVFQPHPRRRYRRNYGGQTDYDEEFVREVIQYAVAHPTESCRRIADRFGVHHETVRRWTQQGVDRRKANVDTVALRTESAIVLEWARTQAVDIYEAARHARAFKGALDALTRVESLTGTHAKLMGLNMPVKVDVAVTALSEAERELQEMIAKAQAATEAAEADVIAQASEDPDL